MGDGKTNMRIRALCLMGQAALNDLLRYRRNELYAALVPALQLEVASYNREAGELAAAQLLASLVPEPLTPSLFPNFPTS